MKKKYKFMKKSEREKYNLITITYYFFCVMLILLIHARLISTDLWGSVQGFFNITGLVYMFFLLVPVNMLVYVSTVSVAVWLLNQTRYFAWPPDKVAHSVVQVSMIVALFETLISGGLGFDLNPLNHIYVFSLYPDEQLTFAARISAFLTLVFVPFFLYTVRFMDYNYPVSTLVSLEAAFLAGIIGLLLSEVMGLSISLTSIRANVGQVTSIVALAILYAAAFLILHIVMSTWYSKEHAKAVRAGTVYVEPSWQRVHVLGYYWRPGQATEAGNKRLIAILIAILLGLIAMFVVTGMLKI